MGDPAPVVGADDAISATSPDVRHERLVDYALAVVVFAFCGWVVWITQTAIPRGFRTDPLGPAAVPALIAYAIAGLAVALVLTRLFGMRWLKPQSVGLDESFPEPGATFSTARLVAMTILSALYLGSMETVGYVIASFLYGAAVLLVVGVRDPLRVLAPAALFVAVLYGVFELGLKVPLPPGPFGG